MRWLTQRIPDETKRRLRTRGREHCLHVVNLLGRGPRPTGGQGVVVSMTTYPARISNAYLAIESILAGRIRPAEICLWLARDEASPSDVPKELLRLRRRGLRIEFVDRNFKPGNKLVHAIERFPDRPIVVADDDVLYPEGWLADLLAAHQQHPDDIVCHRAHYIGMREDGSLLPYTETMDANVGGDRPSFRLLATGVSGVLYPPGCLDDRVFDHEAFLELCPTADDIWFKAMSALAGTRTRRVRPHDVHFRTVTGSQERSLMQMNVEAGRNDRALEAVVDRYDLRPVLLQG